LANLREQYGCGPVALTGTESALYERHLLFDNVVKPTAASARERFEAFARAVRDILSQWHYEHEPETRAALDLIFGDYFSRAEPGVFAPLCDTPLTHGDPYMHLADLKAYLEADQRLLELYGDLEAWARKAVLNVAGSGKFSSDRTIAEYAAGIWNAEPCPVSLRSV
jgi:glucan phosphorylase